MISVQHSSSDIGVCLWLNGEQLRLYSVIAMPQHEVLYSACPNSVDGNCTVQHNNLQCLSWLQDNLLKKCLGAVCLPIPNIHSQHLCYMEA